MIHFLFSIAGSGVYGHSGLLLPMWDFIVHYVCCMLLPMWDFMIHYVCCIYDPCCLLLQVWDFMIHYVYCLYDPCCLLLQVWDFMILYSQFIVFIFIDILRKASDTLPRIILVCSLIMYVRTAFQSFEDEYRAIKEVVFAICKDFTHERKGMTLKAEK